MEKDKLIHAISWSVGYLIVYGVLTVIGNFLLSDRLLIICGLIGGLYVLIHAFFIKYKRERLFVNGLLSAFAVMCLGVLAGKNDVLVPTCGIGDYFYYALWISGIHTVSDSIYAYFSAVCMILLGSCIHYAIIMRLCQRENYKGFPGTVFPFLCIAIQYFVLYFWRG